MLCEEKGESKLDSGDDFSEDFSSSGFLRSHWGLGRDESFGAAHPMVGGKKRECTCSVRKCYRRHKNHFEQFRNPHNFDDKWSTARFVLFKSKPLHEGEKEG